jgi:sugar phosphate isomerase/epimerase
MLLGLDSASYSFAAGGYLLRSAAAAAEPPALTAEELLARARRLRLSGLQLEVPRFLESREYLYLSGLRSRAEQLGLYLELSTSGADLAHLQDMVRIAHMLGATVLSVRLEPSRHEGRRHWLTVVQRARATFEKLMETASRYHIRIGLENCCDFRRDELKRLVEQVGDEHFGVCLNVAHPLGTIEDPVETVEALAACAVSVHLKDYRVVRSETGVSLVGCALGAGVVDLPRVLAVLRQAQPDLRLNIETGIEKTAVPCLQPEFLDRFDGVTALELASVLRRAEAGPLHGYPDPLAWSQRDLLAYESKLVEDSVDYARQVLGSASLDLGI